MWLAAYLTMAWPVDADAVARAVVRAGRRRGHHVPLAPQEHQLIDLAPEAAAEATHIVLHTLAAGDVILGSPHEEDTESPLEIHFLGTLSFVWESLVLPLLFYNLIFQPLVVKYEENNPKKSIVALLTEYPWLTDTGNEQWSPRSFVAYSNTPTQPELPWDLPIQQWQKWLLRAQLSFARQIFTVGGKLYSLNRT